MTKSTIWLDRTATISLHYGSRIGRYDDSYDSHAPTSAAKDYGSDAALSVEPAAEPATETAPAEQEAAPAETVEDIVIDNGKYYEFDNRENKFIEVDE
jgi:hypothetical protein